YPDELHLHFGHPIHTRGPKDRILTRGSYILSGAASAWAFKSARIGGAIYFAEPHMPLSMALRSTPGTVLKDEEIDHLLEKAGTSGAAVVLFDILPHPFGYGLIVGLSDNSVVTITPLPDIHEEGDKLPEVPDWELFTPYNRY